MSRPREELEDPFSNYLSPFAPPVNGSARTRRTAANWEAGPFVTELADETDSEVPQEVLEHDELEDEEFEEESEDQREHDELEDTELGDPESGDEAESWPIGWAIVGSGQGSAVSASPPSAGVDPSVALAPFTNQTRLLMPARLLTAAENANALQWNRQQHPSQSGVDPAHIRTDVARYVDLSAVSAAIRQYNTTNPSAPIQLGAAPLDAVLTEAIHQFQAKCFFESAQIDGKAGESTLDSLGLVNRTGMNTVDRVHTEAQRRLRSIDIGAKTGGEFTAANWFQHMMNPTFLGWRFTSGGTPRGVHLFFMRKLRVAENALLAMPKYRGMTPVELGTALGFDQRSEEHKGARPTVPQASMHTYGLAVDIKYTGNPWVKRPEFYRALTRSSLLMSGVRTAQSTTGGFLHALGSDAAMTTARIYDTLAERDRDFRNYLRLNGSLSALKAVLERRRARGTAGVFTSNSETTDQAARRWMNDIASDLRNMRSGSEPFLTRDPLRGFLNLNRDLVIALRDTACLSWGAVDFGSSASGDVMHFDDRVCGLGRDIAKLGGSYRPTSGHPCIGCVGVASAREATEIEESAEDFSSAFAGEEFGPESEDQLERDELEDIELEDQSEEEGSDELEQQELEDTELEDSESWDEAEDALESESDFFAPESLADEQSLAEELGEEEAGGGRVAYPSGESLRVVAGAAASKADEYWDPFGTGVPLVDTSDQQAKKHLTANFTVAELARSGSHRFDKARIDPKLVRCLQAIRARVGKAVRVNSGYRSWGYNQQLYRGRNQTATLSRHCSGQAADIGVAGMTGLDVAKAAIDACGGNIGVGIDKGYAHIDVRGKWATWTYPGLGGATERRRALEIIEQYRSQRGGTPSPRPAAPSPTRPGAPVPRSPAPSAPPATRPSGPVATRDPDVGSSLRIAGAPVSAAAGAEPELPGMTVGSLIEQWRRQICPEIPAEILRAFIRYESGGRFDDATHGTKKNRWTSPDFYELGLFQTPAGLHGLCTSGDRRAKDCKFSPPGQEKPGSPSTWVRLCKRIGADPQQWRNPTTQVRVGLHDLEDGAAALRKAFPDLFPNPGSDWDLRMAVLYRFSRGGGAARSFLMPFRAQLAGMSEDERWGFLRDRQVVVKRKQGSAVRLFKGENVEKKMALAAKLGYVPR